MIQVLRSLRRHVQSHGKYLVIFSRFDQIGNRQLTSPLPHLGRHYKHHQIPSLKALLSSRPLLQNRLTLRLQNYHNSHLPKDKHHSTLPLICQTIPPFPISVSTALSFLPLVLSLLDRPWRWKRFLVYIIFRAIRDTRCFSRGVDVPFRVTEGILCTTILAFTSWGMTGSYSLLPAQASRRSSPKEANLRFWDRIWGQISQPRCFLHL